MKQFIMDCYEVSESYDRDTTHVAYVSSSTLADALVAKSKGYRSKHTYKRIITVYDTMEEIEENSKENLRKSALAKLTPQEIAALGL